jgi:hypothetical protein
MDSLFIKSPKGYIWIRKWREEEQKRGNANANQTHLPMAPINCPSPFAYGSHPLMAGRLLAIHADANGNGNGRLFFILLTSYLSPSRATAA